MVFIEPITSNPALKAIIEKAVKPILSARQPDTIGKIVEYYPENHTADIEIYVAGAEVQRYGIPLPRVSGIIGRDPRPGDDIWVSFYNGDMSRPYVVMVFDGNNKMRDELTLQQKSLIPDTWDGGDYGIFADTGENWHDTFMDAPAMVDIDRIMQEESRASANTVGLVHPVNGASVTIDDAGRIEALTINGMGVRLDPNSGVVTVFGSKVNIWCDTLTINGKEVTT